MRGPIAKSGTGRYSLASIPADYDALRRSYWGAFAIGTPTKTFDFVLPWLLLVASLALSFGRKLGEWLRRRWRIKPAAVLIVQFGLGVYGGYFGGAVGIMMMAIWGLLDNRDLKSLNAPRTLLVSAANTMAVLTFILARAVHWPEPLSCSLLRQLEVMGAHRLVVALLHK